MEVSPEAVRGVVRPGFLQVGLRAWLVLLLGENEGGYICAVAP
jgi:hypothetical protein